MTKKPQSITRSLIYSVVSVLVGVGIALTLRAFVFAPYTIPTNSMHPTLPVGSVLFIDKLPIHQDIRRGDVIVFKDQLGWLEGAETSFIAKRVIGLPGDILEYNSNIGFTINGEVLNEDDYAQGLQQVEPFSTTIPKGKYWVMGDNRLRSADSLQHYSIDEKYLIDESSIEGRSMFAYIPSLTFTQLNIDLSNK